MAQEGYDKLMKLTDSRYRLTMIVGRRAAQLKTGMPSLLEEGELAPTANTVSIAMKELELGRPIVWGSELPEPEELRRAVSASRQEQESPVDLGANPAAAAG